MSSGSSTDLKSPNWDAIFQRNQQLLLKLAREAAAKAITEEKQRIRKAWAHALRLHSALKKKERLRARINLIRQWQTLREDMLLLAPAERRRLMSKLRRQLPDVYRGLVGVFNNKRGAIVKRTYRTYRKRGTCMYNLMLGMGSALTGRAQRARRYRVWRTIRKAVTKRYGKKEQMRHLMEAARRQGFASRAVKLRYRGRRGRHRWVPSLRNAIMSMVGPDAGWYFFGLALHRGYHCVFITVDYRTPSSPKLFRMDQYGIDDITNDVNDAMLQFNPVKDKVKGYTRFAYSRLWQFIPPAS